MTNVIDYCEVHLSLLPQKKPKNITFLQTISHKINSHQSHSDTRNKIRQRIVASTCTWNHIISDKFKTEPVFELHILQNSSLVQFHTSASDCKCVENIPGSHLLENFSVLSSHS